MKTRSRRAKRAKKITLGMRRRARKAALASGGILNFESILPLIGERTENFPFKMQPQITYTGAETHERLVTIIKPSYMLSLEREFDVAVAESEDYDLLTKLGKDFHRRFEESLLAAIYGGTQASNPEHSTCEASGPSQTNVSSTKAASGISTARSDGLTIAVTVEP